LFLLGSGAPFIIQCAKPPQRLEKLVAKGGLEPSEIVPFWGPLATALQPGSMLIAHGAPLALSLAELDAAPNKITPFDRQRQVRAPVARRSFAKWTMPLIDHPLFLPVIGGFVPQPNQKARGKRSMGSA